ncbi:hypothetical protein OUZ56_010818 [Daphnia magna]|uniref:Uncharacterized protein n=1 Tax=Daphnia magna TaxID=35525 RepID=A0ABQ9YYL8_9CRUS|nr:hypothetical protein OUZ56_010818 [Daphnia magna]
MLYWENKATIMAHIRQIPTVSDIAQWKSMITTQVQTDQHVTASSSIHITLETTFIYVEKVLYLHSEKSLLSRCGPDFRTLGGASCQSRPTLHGRDREYEPT